MFSISMNRAYAWLPAAAACVICSYSTGSWGGVDTVDGDPVRGKEIYAQCAGCHELRKNDVGPMHCGLLGRPAGSVPDFAYSEAMKDSGIVWSPEELNEFLTLPIAYVSGTKMGFAGLPDPRDRADVIAYIQQANNDPAVCPRKAMALSERP